MTSDWSTPIPTLSRRFVFSSRVRPIISFILRSGRQATGIRESKMVPLLSIIDSPSYSSCFGSSGRETSLLARETRHERACGTHENSLEQKKRNSFSVVYESRSSTRTNVISSSSTNHNFLPHSSLPSA